MENENRETPGQETPAEELLQEGSGYTPRPLWQRIAAWVGLILFLLVILMYYINIMRGGL